MKPAVFSFFSGAGFLDLGFEDTGFEIARVNEIYKPFLSSYQYARLKLKKKEPMFGFDLSSIDTFLNPKKLVALKRQIKELQSGGKQVGFIGGPPCPDFSIAGKNRGRTGDNGRLSKSYINLICKVKPDFFLFENVKGLWRTHKHREFYDSLKLQLNKSGYKTFDRLTNAIEYGAPQDRDRIILVGFLTPPKSFSVDEKDWQAAMKFPNRSAFEFRWPESDGSSTTSTIKDLPTELTVGYWFEKNRVIEHPNQKHGFVPRAALPKFKTVKEGDVSKKSFKRLHRNRYSPTAAYGNNEVHIHPTAARRITVAEALAIQSLPVGFEFPDNMTLTDMFKAIGNGVPYLAAEGLAKMVKNSLRKLS